MRSFKYLGVPISFKGQVLWTYGPHSHQIISRSIYKITVDSIDKAKAVKVCWENVAIPSVLFGSETETCETTNFERYRFRFLSRFWRSNGSDTDSSLDSGDPTVPIPIPVLILEIQRFRYRFQSQFWRFIGSDTDSSLALEI